MDPLVMVRAIHFASCMMLTAIPVFSIWILPSGSFRSRAGAILRGRFRLVSMTSAAVALLSAVVEYLLVARDLTAETDVGLISLLSDTHSGHLFLLRTALLAGVIAVTLKGNVWALMCVSALVSGSLAWGGHAAACCSSPFGIGFDVVHLLSAGVWPGGLVPLAIYLNLNLDALDAQQVIIVIRRFSLCSLLAVATLAGSGVSNACLLLGSFSALLSTTYGHLLVAKILFFLAIIGVAARNLILVNPRIHETSAKNISELRRNVAVELTFATVVLLLTGALGMQSPH